MVVRSRSPKPCGSPGTAAAPRCRPRPTRRVEAARALKGDLIAREIPIYGVTTGFGDSAHRQIAPEKAAQLQQNMLRFLGAGTGQIASPEVTRATMLFRANCLAKGNSGVRVELIERLLDAAQPRHPAADPRARLVRRVAVIWCRSPTSAERSSARPRSLYEGAIREAADVLAELGLEPLELEAKEGLALTNGTSFMSGFAVARRRTTRASSRSSPTSAPRWRRRR